MRSRVALLIVVLALPILASCGGDSGEPLTEAEYRAQGNTLCQAWSDGIADLALPSNPTDQELVDFSAEAGRLGQDYSARLLDLHPPESLTQDQAALQARYDEYDELVASSPQTQAEVDSITEAGDAISTALGDIWSGCRDR